ncbi:MAG TPA: LPS export ABC transporter ATP-binding protein [Planctomycetes bacterium]|nr:LPS export ABC transporter ATP-binding protein [Planctomycetota bacterium]
MVSTGLDRRKANKEGYLLEARNLVKTYKKRRVVDRVSLGVRAGEIVGLLGSNGAGKTTSFRMIVGMIGAEEGQVFFNGKEITKLPMFKRARLGLGYLSQEPSIFRKMTVENNILAVLEAIGEPRKTRKSRLESLLGELELTSLRKNIAETLSGGERRRLEITRSLATNPKLILLDEPFSGVDPIAVQEIQGILEDLSARGIGILITDHNVHETLKITERSYIINKGKVLEEGPPAALIASDEVRKVYLGDSFSPLPFEQKKGKGPREGLDTEEKKALEE